MIDHGSGACLLEELQAAVGEAGRLVGIDDQVSGRRVGVGEQPFTDRQGREAVAETDPDGLDCGLADHPGAQGGALLSADRNRKQGVGAAIAPGDRPTVPYQSLDHLAHLRRGRWFVRAAHANDVAVLVGDKVPFAVVEDDEVVVPRIGDDRAASDRDVECLDDDAAVCGDESLDRGRDVVDGEVGLGARPFRLQHELGFRPAQPEPGAGSCSPQHPVAQVAVEVDGVVEIGDRQCQTIDPAEDGIPAHHRTLRQRQRR